MSSGSLIFPILKPLCVHSQWVTSPIFWSVVVFSNTVQLCAILMCSLSLSPPLSSPELWLHEGQLSQSHKSSDMYVLPVKPAILLHTKSGQRSCLRGIASYALSSQPGHCQRCGHRKYILLQNLFVTAASPRSRCKWVLSPLTLC